MVGKIGVSHTSGWEFSVTGPDGYTWSGFTSGSSRRASVTICDLVPGEYTITEVTPLPAGWTNTDPGGSAPYEKTVEVRDGKTTSVKFGNAL